MKLSQPEESRNYFWGEIYVLPDSDSSAHKRRLLNRGALIEIWRVFSVEEIELSAAGTPRCHISVSDYFDYVAASRNQKNISTMIFAKVAKIEKRIFRSQQ